jgi:hypothetical protein
MSTSIILKVSSEEGPIYGIKYGIILRSKTKKNFHNSCCTLFRGNRSLRRQSRLDILQSALSLTVSNSRTKRNNSKSLWCEVFRILSSEEIQRCFGGAVRRGFNGESSVIVCYTTCKGGTIIRLVMIPGVTYSLLSSFDLFGGAGGKLLLRFGVLGR